ncbi:hypothetical protein T484DRAFT_1830782 [Baffinella frigidus]|nr:hypothetical protein T484DRAFT_1830782 [Cryptophyta sp. CCMP2293]
MLGAALAQTEVKLTFGKALSKETVKLNKGGELRVALDSNPTTGYSWSMEGALTGMKEEAASKYQAPVTGLVGAGGTQLFTFQAAEAGTHQLVFIYKRPWEQEAASRAEVDVVVA